MATKLSAKPFVISSVPLVSTVAIPSKRIVTAPMSKPKSVILLPLSKLKTKMTKIAASPTSPIRSLAPSKNTLMPNQPNTPALTSNLLPTNQNPNQKLAKLQINYKISKVPTNFTLIMHHNQHTTSSKFNTNDIQ